MSGRTHPLGAAWDGQGTNFALFAARATSVELAVGDRRIPLERGARGVWSARVDVGPGSAYGYHVDGPRGPGNAFDPTRALIDPYARAIQGDVAAGEGRGLVIDPTFDWQGDRAPRTPWTESVIYECHVKGMTARHPQVPPELRGSYLGFGSEPVIEHLRALGVTAVELLPVHHAHPERHLRAMGRINYWGYSTLGFFAPDPRFASGDGGQQVTEFKAMVRALHAAGIEVILDVVYNHTAEGGASEPALSFRGIDNAAYYHLHPAEPETYVDYTGCGNTFNMAHPRGLQLVMDSLRYWVEEMHVDGFRFDLAPALGRDTGNPRFWQKVLYDVMQQDGVLAPVKLIAEPWDLGLGGYKLGRFPEGWAEWNGKFRDTVRRFWKGEGGQLGELASRLAGSSDVFGGDPLRGPTSSINFVACHDGFTLADLVSYEQKQNQANGEDGRDGCTANWSKNWGVEGPTDDPEILALRARAQRNLLASVVCSQGVPMLSMGDELGRTQRGNNNGYCLDDETTWVDWELGDDRRALLEFTRELFALRREHPLLRRREFLAHEDLTWLRPDGHPFGEADWHQGERRALAARVHGPEEDLLLVLNASAHDVSFELGAGGWSVRIDTSQASNGTEQRGALTVPPRSLLLLEQTTHDGPREIPRTLG